MKVVNEKDLRDWMQDSDNLHNTIKSIGHKKLSDEYFSETIGLPTHLKFLAEELGSIKQLTSIPFYSLCKGLFLPLTGMYQDKAASLFGVEIDPPLKKDAREKLLSDFLEKDLGLSLVQKISCVLGDPFQGKASRFKRDSLLRLLKSLRIVPNQEVMDRLSQVGDIAILFSEGKQDLKVEPRLTAAEVLWVLYLLPKQKRNKQFELLRSLFGRCGKLEAYFLSKLILKRAGFGFDYEGAQIAQAMGKQYKVSEELVKSAMALTDTFTVAHTLMEKGKKGLEEIQLQPLTPIRPALAMGSSDGVKKFPTWVERKYDGIRLMLHKSTDLNGSVLCGAYTRRRNDWLELVPGLDTTIKMLPCQTAILDGELYGTVMDLDGVRLASVYEVYAALQGAGNSPVNLKFAAFDVIYLNGQDLTQQPLRARRQFLQNLVVPIGAMPLPVPIVMAEGQLAQDSKDVNRLYQHFRSQGYEGIITKDLEGPYRLAQRDPSWLKRKPEITLDLVILGAILAVTSKKTAGMYGSYVVGAKNNKGEFVYVGDVAGVDVQRDQQIQQEIMREGLMTGQRIERTGAGGKRTGFELRPHIVITIKFEGIVKDFKTGELSLRDPKLAYIRSDKSALEADTVKSIEELYLKQRVG